MNSAPRARVRLTRQSLQVRLTVLTMSICLFSLWGLAGYLLQHVNEHISESLSAQQHDVVQLHGNAINAELATRLQTAERVTELFSAKLMAEPLALQAFLEGRPVLPFLFNGGTFITDTKGVAIAAVPASLGRLGLNFSDRDSVAHALSHNASKISKPVIGKNIKQPVVSFAAPIRDGAGSVIGSFVGVIDLSKPNFLDGVLNAKFGQSGQYTLVSKDWELVVSSSNRALTLKPVPHLELGPGLDQLLSGKTGFAVLRNTQGQSLLVSAQDLPIANWTLLASIPVDEVFAPMAHIRHTLIVATLLVSLLTAGLVFWLLRHQLGPIDATAQSVTAQARGEVPLQLLPSGRQDELGQLIQAFNALLSMLFQREAALKANEQALAETAKHLEQAQTISQLGNWSFGLKDNTTTWSRQMYVMFRVDPGSFTPSFDSFMKAVHKEDRALVESALKAALTTGTPHQLEHRVVLTGGQVKWLLQRGHTELDAQGKPVRLVGTVQDITERKLSETALAQSHDLLKTIVETMPMRVFWKNTDLRYMGCNTAFARDAGKQTPTDLIGRNDHDMGWAAQADLYRADDMAVMVNDAPRIAFEEPQSTPNGDTIWLRTSKIPLKDRAGLIVGVLGLYEDITQQKRDDERLQKLSLVAEQSPFGIAITDLQERFEYVNPAFTRKTGYAAAELLGNTPRMMHSGMNDPAVYTQLWAQLKTGQAWEGEIINRRRDGSTYVDRSIITPLREGDAGVTHYVSIQEDVTQQQQTAAELARYQNQLEEWVAQRTLALTRAEFLNNQALDLAKAGPWDIDFSQGDAHITSSARTVAILGVPDRQNFRYAIHDDMYLPAAQADPVLAAQALKGYQDALAGDGSLLDINFPYRRPVDGREIWLRIKGDILRNHQGKPTHVYGVMMDITATRQAEEALRQAKADADAASRSKSEFLANMSHEIRTPLNAISGMARLIGQGTLSTEQRERLGKLELAGDHLLRTINNILDLSKIEAGKFELTKDSLRIDDVVSSVTTILADRAQTKQIRLDSHVDAFPAHLLGDQTRLTQALLNLATNAVKFTETGSVSVAARLVDDSADSVLVKFEVRDTGVGIAGDALHRVFNAFEQADNSTARQHGGTGLGLAITRHIAQLMGGEAGAESTLGQGSLFWFTARLGKAADAAVAPHADEDWSLVLHTQFAGRHVLLAEDDAFNQEIALMLLQDVGQHADLAADGREAVAKAQQVRYDLILMDMQMPHMDGLEAARRIRQMAGCGQVPILALTGNAFAEDRARCLAAGMDDFVTKPIDPPKLYRAMVQAYRRADGGDNA